MNCATSTWHRRIPHSLPLAILPFVGQTASLFPSAHSFVKHPRSFCPVPTRTFLVVVYFHIKSSSFPHLASLPERNQCQNGSIIFNLAIRGSKHYLRRLVMRHDRTTAVHFLRRTYRRIIISHNLVRVEAARSMHRDQSPEMHIPRARPMVQLHSHRQRPSIHHDRVQELRCVEQGPLGGSSCQSHVVCDGLPVWLVECFDSGSCFRRMGDTWYLSWRMSFSCVPDGDSYFSQVVYVSDIICDAGGLELHHDINQYKGTHEALRALDLYALSLSWCHSR